MGTVTNFQFSTVIGGCPRFSDFPAERDIRMNCESIIYLDADFLSKKYEDLEQKPVMTSLVRDEGLKAGIEVLFASGGAHTKEVKTYECSVYGMLKNLHDKLDRYPI